jgi:hypothetical protein
MLDHQGAGLQRFAGQATQKVLAMVSHGDDQQECLLLQSLCARLAAQGYAVALVDATLDETDSQPGLAQLLDDNCWRGTADLQNAAWVTFPAKRGLRRLCHRNDGSSLPLFTLERHLSHYNVLVVHATAQALSSLLPGSGLQPVLTAAATPASLVSAYHALKQLLLIGKLQPTIVSMVNDSPQSSASLHSAVGRSLQDCAMTFLGCQLDTVQVRMGDDCDSDDLERLALRLLEAGTPVPPPGTPQSAGPWLRGRLRQERHVGSH